MRGLFYTLEEVYEWFVEAYELALEGRGAYDPEVEAVVAKDQIVGYTYERAAYVKSRLLGNVLLDFDSVRDDSDDFTVDEFISSWSMYRGVLGLRLTELDKKIDALIVSDGRVELKNALNAKEDVVIETRLVDWLLDATSRLGD